MNVAFDPWIPVVTMDGKPELASLSDVLTTGDKFADLSVRPHERVALMRLFLCVTHAALHGPKDYDEWIEVPKKLPDAVRSYLKDWKESFELFHEKKPWLQVKDLKGDNTSPKALLDFELSTGNNSTLFDHSGASGNRAPDLARLPLNLITYLNFSSGGGSPIAQWAKKKTSQVGNPDAPCLSQSMAHCLLRGKTLKETIHFNLPTYERIKKNYLSFHKKKDSYEFSAVDIGKAVWENFPKSPDDSKSISNATATYLGRLVPISRWVHLIENTDQMFCCNGFKYNTYKDGFPAEPTAAVRVVTKKDKKGIETKERRVVGMSPSKASWRELSSLLIKRDTAGLGGPLAMENASYDSEFDFHVCAMTRDQASMDIAIESVFHITPSLHTHLSSYQDEVAGSDIVTGAEGHARKLRWAIEEYRSTVDIDWKPRIKRTQAKDQPKLKERLTHSASLAYWTTVEKNLPLLMTHIEAIGGDNAIPTRDKWRKKLYSAARDAYRIACSQETPRQMRAFAKGWQKLPSGKSEQVSNSNTKDKEVNNELAY